MAVGESAAELGHRLSYSTIIGPRAAGAAADATNSIFIGSDVAYGLTNAPQNIFIGNYVGRHGINFTNNIVLGWGALAGSNNVTGQFIVHATNLAVRPLIQGDLASGLLRINNSLYRSSVDGSNANEFLNPVEDKRFRNSLFKFSKFF